MEENSLNENEVENKTVVVQINPAEILKNKSSFKKIKVNKVYVVPNRASKKNIREKISDPTIKVIDASSIYDSYLFQPKRHLPYKDEPDSDAEKVTTFSNIPNKDCEEECSDKQKSVKADNTIHISPYLKVEFDSEVTEHEISATDGQENSEHARKDEMENMEEEEQDPLETYSEARYHQSHLLGKLQTKPGLLSGSRVQRKKISEDQIKLAIEDVLKSNMSVKRAAHVYGIRYSVLVSRISKVGCSGKGALGADPALTEKEESALVDWIRSRYRTGCPVKKIDLIHRVADIVSDGRTTRFKEGMPGEKWFMNFMSRNPSVSLLGPTTRFDSREVPSKSSLLSWFKRCEDHLHAFGQEHLIHDSRKVGSVEELTLCLLSSKTKVSKSSDCRLSTIYFPKEASGNITVLLGACADGTLTPPMPVFSCKKPPPSLIKSIPSGWGIGLSKDGSINKEVLHSYFKNILIPWLTEQERLPFLLFIDKLKSSLSLDTADFCAQKGLLIYNLFPNSCKVIQPLQKSVIDPVKKSWGALSTHKNDKEALLHFCPILNQLLFDLAPPFSIVESFRSCGIHPFDSKAPDYSKCLLIREDRHTKNFSGNDYAVALEVFEDVIGKAKTEIFHETLKGFKLLKSEDGPLFSVWHKLVSKVDITRSCSEPEEYRHERIIRGAYKKLPRPEMYLMVVDGDEEEDPSIQDYRNFNRGERQTFTISDNGEGDGTSSNHDHLQIEADDSIINVFPKRECDDDDDDFDELEESVDEEEAGEQSEHSSSAFWKEHYLGGRDAYLKGVDRIREERKLERKMRKERKIESIQPDETVSKKLKKAIGPRHCFQCMGGKGKLIKCMVCKSRIHFECMMEEEQQIISDLQDGYVAFEYICPSCSY